MAKTNTQVDEPREAPGQGAASTAKKAKRPSKKRATKKPTKKPVKKRRATAKQENADDATSSAPSTAKKRATKKPTKKSSKKPAKKRRAIAKKENADGTTSSASRTAKKPAAKQQAAQTTQEAKASTSSAPRTSKKRTTKKPAKKQVEKQQAAQTTQGADATSSAPRTSKKAKKPAATRARAETPPKSSEAVEQVATTAVDDRGQQKVKPTAPADRAQNQDGATAASDQARQKAETPAATDQTRNAEPAGQPPESAPTEEMQWGRRTRRSGPIGWEGRGGVSPPVQPTRRPDAQADAPAVETPAEPEPKPPPPNRAAQGRTRSDQNDRNAQRPSSNRSGNEKKPDGASRKLAEILAQSWTEDKTRRFLGEGFLSSLSAELVNDGKRASLPDAEALKKPLEMIRKVLADECMVADDVSDLLLLDVVMNALSDRIDVCRLQAESDSLADIDAILELRYKADRRLIEAVNALKNA